MGEQIELGKPTLFWGKVGDAELKPLEVVEGDFDIEPLEEPIDIKYAPTPTWQQKDKGGFCFSFEMTLDKKQTQNLRKMFKMRLPRKLKKRYKKVYADYFKVKPQRVRLNTNYMMYHK